MDNPQIEELFHQLLALPPEERAAAAARVADGDRALELVDAYEQAMAANVDTLARAPKVSSGAGQRKFGAHRTIRLLGAGGMGSVYLAERIDGQFEHKVAIKVIGQHIAAGPAFEARFAAERQILAGLNHPNIARLLDGNVSESGEPYLVLEYVDGEPLDAYCARHALSQRQRIELFLKVCNAVEFAHRNLVVHLDLKPANILVTTEGEPKLLDFGAAKLLSASPSGYSVPMLTLRYASPEQLQSLPASTLSDVYSLGVVLYELLSGAHPFGAADSWEAALARATQDVSIQPSAALQGDLWTIVRKALDRAPERRYSSARELAEDLNRFVSGYPILARPSTLRYRAAKFVRRNRVSFGASMLLLAAILAGAGSTLWQARKAQRRFHELRQLAQFVISDLHTGLQDIPGTTKLQRLSVERSLEYLDRLGKEAGNDAALRVEVADGYRKLGDVLGNPFRSNLSERAKAEAAYRSGLAVLEGLPGSVAVRSAGAELRLQLGGVRSFGAETKAGLEEIRRAVEELKRLAAGNPADLEARLAASRGVGFLGVRVTAGGGNIEQQKAGEANALLDEAAALSQAVLDKSPGHPAAIRQLAQIENDRAILYGSTEPAKAIEYHRRAIQWLDRIPVEAAAALPVRRLRASVLLNTGWAEGQAGSYQESIAHITEANAILAAWSAADPENNLALYTLTGVFRTRGIVHTYQGDRARAAEDFLAAAALHQRLIERDPKSTVYRFLRAELLIRSGRAAESREGLRLMGELADAPSAQITHVFGACRWFVETAVPELRNPQRAAGYCRQAMERTQGQDPDAFSGLAGALEMMGDSAGAMDAIRKALNLLPPQIAGQAPTQQRKNFEEMASRISSRRK